MQIKNINIKFSADDAFFGIIIVRYTFKMPKILKIFGRNSEKGLNMIAKFVYGDVCLMEMHLSSKNYNKIDKIDVNFDWTKNISVAGSQKITKEKIHSLSKH